MGGGWWVEEKSRIKTNSAKLKLELRLSLAIFLSSNNGREDDSEMVQKTRNTTYNNDNFASITIGFM